MKEIPGSPAKLQAPQPQRIVAILKHYQMELGGRASPPTKRPRTARAIRGISFTRWSAFEAGVRFPVVEQVADAVRRALEDRGGGKATTPTVGSTNGITLRAETRAAILPTKLTQVAEWITENAQTSDEDDGTPEGLLVDDSALGTRFQNWFHGLGLLPGCPGRKSGRAWPIFKSWGRCGGTPPQKGEGRTK